MTYPGAGLLAHNLRRVLLCVRAETQMLALIAAEGPQHISRLESLTGLNRRRLERQLTDAKRQGYVRSSGRGPTALWGMPGQPWPERRRAALPETPRRRWTDAPPSTSWWLTPDRDSFRLAAQDRAKQAGWDA